MFHNQRSAPMRRFLHVLFFFAFLALPLLAQKTKWVADPAHSKVGFSVSHMVITDVDGKFDTFDIVVYSDKPDFSDAKAQVSIDVNSINTGNEKRDAHLRSPDFFDAEKYPKITFVSKRIEKVGKNRYKLVGDLTMKGVTKEIELDVEYRGTVTDPWGNERAGFKVTGEVNRMDFGINWNKTLDRGGLVVGETVKIDIDLELIKQKS